MYSNNIATIFRLQWKTFAVQSTWQSRTQPSNSSPLGTSIRQPINRHFHMGTPNGSLTTTPFTDHHHPPTGTTSTDDDDVGSPTAEPETFDHTFPIIFWRFHKHWNWVLESPYNQLFQVISKKYLYNLIRSYNIWNLE